MLFLQKAAATTLFVAVTLLACAQTTDSLPQPKVPIDTSPVYWITAQAPEERVLFTDTTLDYAFRMYDPARQADWTDWGTLGLLGSPARPLLYTPAPRMGFAHGVQALDLYRNKAADLRFFKHTRTFSEVGFSQGRTQNDNGVRAVLSRTFSGGTTAAFDYRTFLNVGQYRYQSARNIALSLGFHVPVGQRYEGFLTYTVNANQLQENGGLTADADFGSGTFSGPINAPIRLNTQTAQSRYAEKHLAYTHYYRFSGKNSGRQFRAGHQIGFRDEDLKFAHNSPGADTIFYDTFMVDRRGIRQFTEVARFDNHFELSTYRNRGTEGQVADVFAAGIQYNRIKVAFEPGDSIIQNWFLTGRLSVSPNDRFRLEVQGGLGILANLGEYQVQGLMAWSPGKIGRLEAGVLSQRYPPALIYHRLQVSGRPFWNNDFDKPLETSLWVEYRLPKRLPLRLMARTHLLNNYLYFDTLGLARQTTAPVQIVQFGAEANLKWRFMHLDQTVCLQQTNRDDVLRLPRWFSRSALYFSGLAFQKRLFFQVGFDFRVHAAFKPDAWQPVTGQFILNDVLTQEPYPWLDGFATFKISSFRFFFRYENLGTLLWDKEATYQQTAWHPHLFNSFRLGLSWRLFD